MVSTTSRLDRDLVLGAKVAADLMVADPISIRSEASATEAMTLFTDKGIAAAPVIDEAGRPIGVLSRSDLLVHHTQCVKQQAGEPGYTYAPTFDSVPRPGAAPSPATVTELMTPAVFAVSPSTPVHQVVNDMVGLRVHRLFVVDDAGVLVGVISAMDVLRHLQPGE